MAKQVKSLKGQVLTDKARNDLGRKGNLPDDICIWTSVYRYKITSTWLPCIYYFLNIHLFNFCVSKKKVEINGQWNNLSNLFIKVASTNENLSVMKWNGFVIPLVHQFPPNCEKHFNQIIILWRNVFLVPSFKESGKI